MTNESPPKFALPKTRRDLSNLDDLLVGAIAPPEPAETVREMPTDTQAYSINGVGKPISAHNTMPKSERSTARSMLKLIIEDDLIVAAKVRAVESKTTAAAIVEQALRAYLKS